MRTLPTIFRLKQNNNMSINPCFLNALLFVCHALSWCFAEREETRFPSPLICNYWLPLPEPRVPLNRHSSIRACVTKSLMIRLRSDGQSITWTHSCKYNKPLWIAIGSVDVDVHVQFWYINREVRNKKETLLYTHFVFGWMCDIVFTAIIVRVSGPCFRCLGPINKVSPDIRDIN